jgi:catechol 2,3-dioxygenase-like lactoylglutathione lyase family enzyme
MPEAMECLHMNHINAVVEHFDESVAHFTSAYGAQFNFDMPGEHWHAYLMTIGGTMFQIFVPHQYILHARMGPYYVGIEYKIPDVEAARQEVLRRDMRIVRELGEAFHMHPAEAFGVSWEFYHSSFQDPAEAPIPYPEPIWSAEHWRDENPLGFTGLKRYSVVVGDLAAATEFATGFLGATERYREDRPGVAVEAVGFELADTTLELLSPTGPGEIASFLGRYGDGIRSTVFAVADLEVARAHLLAKGLRLLDGDAPGAIAVDPRDNLGLLFEFSE